MCVDDDSDDEFDDDEEEPVVPHTYAQKGSLACGLLITQNEWHYCLSMVATPKGNSCRERHIYLIPTLANDFANILRLSLQPFRCMVFKSDGYMSLVNIVSKVLTRLHKKYTSQELRVRVDDIADKVYVCKQVYAYKLINF